MNYSYVAIAVLALLLSAFGGAAVAAAPTRRVQFAKVILADQVRDALVRSGVPVHPDQMELLGGVPVSLGEARLKLASFDRLTEKTAKARMECDSGNRCVPFYVVLHWPTRESADMATAKWEPSRTAISPGHREWAVRAGSAATMVVEGQDMRISSPVVCLQNGLVGQRVRVMTPDHKRIGSAEVIESGLVKGVL